MPWGSNPPYPQPHPRPNLLTSCSYSCTARHAQLRSCTARHAQQLRDLGLRLETRDQVQTRSGFVPDTSALPLRATAPIQRPFAIQDLPGFYPITGRRMMQIFPLSTAAAAATAISSIVNPRRHPAVNHDPPAVAGRALSARRKGSSSSPVRSFPSSRSFYPRHRSSSTGMLSPPTSHQHRAHRLAWWSPLL
jgi:hypothetical protein